MYNELKTQIITGFLSTPIIYIPHFHNQLVDEIITDIVSPQDGCYLDLKMDEICEFDIRLGIIDFKTKRPDEDWSPNLEDLLESIVSGKKNVVNGNRIFIFKNADKILMSEEIQSLLQIFVQKYERGDYDPLYTIVLVSSLPLSQLPLGFEKYLSVIEIKPPTVKEIKDYLFKRVGEDNLNNPRQKRCADEMVRTLQGLQMYEVKQTLQTVLSLTNGRINDGAIRLALEEKKKL